MIALRSIVVWCADWPIVAFDTPPDRPVAVMRANRVVSVSPVARAAGVVSGLRRREAQRRCPGVELRDRDLEREARAFEPVVAALDRITPRTEITRPGSCLFPARAPGRYFGGDAAVGRMTRDAVLAVLPAHSGVGVGVADGGFAATLAARRSAVVGDAVVVEEGGSPSFLAGLPIGVLDRPELVGVLERLGLQRLGQFAALSPGDVTARFGAEGALAHGLALGLDPRPPHLSEPPADLEVVAELDPPLERVDQAAFVAKAMADDLHERLAERGLAAVAILISGTTADGHCVERRWRHDGALSSTGVAQRVRWQLDGWLTHSRSTAGALIRLSLRPDDVVADVGRQQSLWGGSVATDARALGAMARVQGILGSDAVRMAEWRGGRSPAEQYRLVPVDLIDRESSPSVDLRPWPGRLPEPPPALVWHRPRRCELAGEGGEMMAVDGRGMASDVPSRMSVESGPWQPIARWAGPWVTDERWWDAVAHRRRARFQVALDDGTAHLVTLEAGCWWVEATYD